MAYEYAGAKKVFLLRSHYLPWLHQRLPQKELVGWESDIACLGHCEPDARIEQMDKLMKSVDVKYRLNGSLWKKYGKGRFWESLDTHELQGYEYVKGINGSKITLTFLSTFNKDTYTRRNFEIPACGSLMLSWRTEDLLSLYEEAKEAEYFSSAEELVDKAKYYLSHERQRQRIAEAGYRKCMDSGYDIYSRMKEWINIVRRNF